MPSSTDNNVSSPKNHREEIANAITHGIGALLSIAALVILVVFSAMQGNTWHIVSFSLFGGTLILLYTASTLYHSLAHTRVKNLFQKFDHISIFLLIAGTYTPFCLVALRGWIGWSLFGLVWGCAIVGTVIKSFHAGKMEVLSTIMYVAMGWAGMIAAKPLYDQLPQTSFVFLLLGGVCYTAGTFFFLKDKNRYYHSIWHLFVLAGSTFHFFSVLGLLVKQ